MNLYFSLSGNNLTLKWQLGKSNEEIMASQAASTRSINGGLTRDCDGNFSGLADWLHSYINIHPSDDSHVGNMQTDLDGDDNLASDQGI